MEPLILITLLVAVVHLYRLKLLRTRSTVKNHEPFLGNLYQVGKCVIAHQRASSNSGTKGSDKSILCMHGWLEDHRYFTELYSAHDGELILVNSCDYHAPNTHLTPQPVEWDDPTVYQTYREGSIEYDAAVLCQAAEALANNKNMLVHGHSRGGAVVLEAAKQRPELFANAEFVLEAAILPEAPIVVGPESPVWLKKLTAQLGLYLFPFMAEVYTKFGVPDFALKGLGPLSERKIRLLKEVYNNPSSIQVSLSNIKSMYEWPLENSTALFNNVPRGTILISETDSVLSRSKMLRSARRNSEHLDIVETTGSSHFISLDIPERLRELIIPSSINI